MKFVEIVGWFVTAFYAPGSFLDNFSVEVQGSAALQLLVDKTVEVESILLLS